jgi:hypothetical protein
MMWVERLARKEKIRDAVLVDVAARAEKVQVDADLGVGVIKQRIARPGQGKSGGYRTIIFFRRSERAVFAYGLRRALERTSMPMKRSSSRRQRATYCA